MLFRSKCTEQEIQRDSLTGEPQAERGYFFDETRMCVVHPEFWALYEQLMTYPRSPHDDILDALEMSIETSKNGRKLFDEIIVV